MNKKIFIISLIFLINCFDYEEKIYLEPDLSGRVYLEYTIPINKKTGNSLISFLPATKEKFLEIYNVNILSFDSEDLEPTLSFKYKKVKVEYSFKKITELEKKIYGNNSINKYGNTIYIQRRFKIVLFKKLDNKFYNFFYNYTIQKFKNRNLKFFIIIPKHFDIITNMGNLPLPGVLNFQLPLEKTFESNNEILWNITIKINPTP